MGHLPVRQTSLITGFDLTSRALTAQASSCPPGLDLSQVTNRKCSAKVRSCTPVYFFCEEIMET